MTEKRSAKKHSLQKSLSVIMVLGWIIPITSICIAVAIIYRNGIIKKTESIMKDSLKSFSYDISAKLNESIEISKKISYDKLLENSWKNFSNGTISHSKLYSEVKGNLYNYFNTDKRFVMSCFYFTDFPEQTYYTARTPLDFQIYQSGVLNKVQIISGADTSDAHIKIVDSRIYIVRNLYTLTNYQKFGTLTIEVDKKSLFENINTENSYDIVLFFNDCGPITVNSTPSLPAESTEIYHRLKAQSLSYHSDKVYQSDFSNYQTFLHESRHRDYWMNVFLIVNKNTLYAELDNIYKLIFFIWIIIIPIILFLLVFIKKNINVPLRQMIHASKGINNGLIGIQVETSHMPNIEFEELKDAFNYTSFELKRMLDYAYMEKLARKEAKILALQSQINPHFLNNTLEMMNWQARISGDITVSKMIEALSTLLNQSMDRSDQRSIPLSEEIRCADAYFYIISMRFGQRLVIEKEIDETLSHVPVPPLILQPVLENAVIHGIETIKNGKICLSIYRKGNTILLEIINTGKNMTPEDVRRVQNILSNTDNPDNEKKDGHVSLGIRNVNERIQLIYGEKYGLSIMPLEEGKTIATITLPYPKPEGDAL